MSNSLVALLTGIGAGGWIYSQMMRRTGGNVKSSLMAAVGAGLAVAFVIYTLFALVFPSSQEVEL